MHAILVWVAMTVWGLQAIASEPPTVQLHARIGADLQTVEGSISLAPDTEIQLLDVQSLLPIPDQDRDLRRTFPGGPHQGWMHIEPSSPGHYTFHSILPRRFGATGLAPRRGLYAQGGWFPQPVVDGRLVPVDWSVEIEVPEGYTIVLNGWVGQSQISWEGMASTLSLAVLDKPHIETLQFGERAAVWVRDQSPRQRRRAQLQSVLESLEAAPQTAPIAIVDAPLRRRLVRSGERQLFLSDRALRVSGPLWQHHSPAIVRGILEAGLPIEDPWERQLASTAISDAVEAPKSVEEQLSMVSWIPEIEALLHDGRLPFYSDIFDETWSGDPVEDELSQILTAEIPGRAMARRLQAIYGHKPVEQMAWDLARGQGLSDAAMRAGIDARDLAQRDVQGPEQDYIVHVSGAGEDWTVEVTRAAPPDAPSEVLQIDIDGSERVWRTDTGSDLWSESLTQRPRQVHIDRSGLVRQSDPANDAWPRASSTTLAFFPSYMSLTQGNLVAAADIVYRPQARGRHAWRLSTGTDDEDLISASLTRYTFLGPLRDRRSRPGRIWMGGSAGILDPNYRPLKDRTVALGGHAGVTWDTRNDYHFPLHGYRVSIYGSGGLVPSEDTWGSVQLSGVKIWSAKGRLALVTRARGGLARGGVEHRLLSLGGPASLLSQPPGGLVGDQLLVAGSELRAQVIRGASLPLPALWLADVNLSAGLEGGLLRAPCLGDTCSWSALGVTAGVSFVGDILGVRPSMLGIWGAIPVGEGGTSLRGDTPPQIVVRFTQPF